MMFLLEQRNFAQFDKVMANHAKIVMDAKELETIKNLHDEFKEAIEGTEGHEEALGAQLLEDPDLALKHQA